MLTRVKDFSASHALPGAQEAGRGHSQTGQRAIPYHMTSCPVYKLGELARGAVIAARGWAGHRSVGGEQLHCASLVLYIPLSLLLLLFSLPLLSY